MFGNTAEKRIAREADKVASLKEDLDAQSWGRVLEIGRHLQERHADEDGAALGAELVSIAQTNISLATRLGIDPVVSDARMMSSGMEVLDGGLAEAAVRGAHAAPRTAGANASMRAADVPARPAADGAEARVVPGDGAESCPHDDALEGVGALVAETAEKADGDGTFDPQEPAETLVFHSTIELPFVLPPLVKLTEASAPAERADATEGQGGTAEGKPQEGDDPHAAEEPAHAADGDAFDPEPASSMPSDAPSAPPEEPEEPEEPAPLRCVASETPMSPDGAAPKPESDPAPAPEPVAEAASPSGQTLAAHRFSRFRNLYESRDGSLCVFEDEHGHLVAVDASKLA